MSINKVFITGATGYIGGSVAALLLKKGYEVSALVRKQADAEKLKALGITPVPGAIHDTAVLRKATENADAVIHTADADDVYSVVTFLEALKGTGKTFVFTSGSSLVGDNAKGEKGDIVYSEDIPVQPKLEKLHRVALNDHILAAAKENVRTIVIVPTMVYGTGTGIKPDSIQVPMLIDIAREKQAGVYIEKGENKWSNVHIEDLAALYVLALENAPTGSYFYAENGSASLKDVAVSISNMLGFGGKSLSISLDNAIEKWGPDAAAYGFASNSLVNADKAKKLLGWQPKYGSILEDIEQGSYKTIHASK
ncbi:NAD-dependent epimerase/dehydratase family protein [Dyadobacter sp. LHD-138]|uniref:NAD-dependent epimerase/dehydratase family protein n=1 Tax=Dyadobacter sp. LHD-138 TaxID=3071413 RepID=UPI0027E0FA5E|nr:NAD-dependent epimerase/dehydratase family protein [Dyadobacter sp. LHD-138]MDQ6480020.1 NAD-dependent epimerase/dehydratase family protein [Dyadobacter sp. LHD-138]